MSFWRVITKRISILAVVLILATCADEDSVKEQQESKDTSQATAVERSSSAGVIERKATVTWHGPAGTVKGNWAAVAYETKEDGTTDHLGIFIHKEHIGSIRAGRTSTVILRQFPGDKPRRWLLVSFTEE